MKTLYCLGGSPQFRIPCIKYGFLMKENENKIKNYLPKGNHIIKDFYNLEGNEKENLVDKWIDQIYPVRSIKRCFEINPSIKLGMKKFYKSLRESLSIGKNKTSDKINKNENNIKENNENNLNDENKIKNLKFIFERNKYNNKELINNESKGSTIYNNIKINYTKDSEEKIHKNIQKTTQTDSAKKLFNYNYPISNESYTLDLFNSLISKNKTKKNTPFLSISNNNNSLSNNSNSRIIFNSKFLNNFDNKNINNYSKSENKNNKNICHHISNKLIKKMNKQIKNKNYKYSNNSIENLIKRRKKRRIETQQNKLNIIYSENEEQFYRKYDKYRKNKFLNGLCLTHINSSPKVILNELNDKINLIKNKVGVVKSIVDKTFPRVLADISLIKKEYKNSQGKEGYNSPYIEKLDNIKKHQQYMNSYFSDPFKIISRNTINCEKNK